MIFICLRWLGESILYLSFYFFLVISLLIFYNGSMYTSQRIFIWPKHLRLIDCCFSRELIPRLVVIHLGKFWKICHAYLEFALRWLVFISTSTEWVAKKTFTFHIYTLFILLPLVCNCICWLVKLFMLGRNWRWWGAMVCCN